MASLKEVKNRISSVSSTRKITSAMKMVASSKLHHAQTVIENMLPYEIQLNGIMNRFMQGIEGDIISPYTLRRKQKRVAVIAYTSNTSLCGGFNSNVIKHLRLTLDRLRHDGLSNSDIEVFPIGKKIAEATVKMGFTIEGDNAVLLDKPSYDEAARIAHHFMERFAKGELDRVILLYNHFKSTSHQVLTEEDFLPASLDSESKKMNDEVSDADAVRSDYIIEPSAKAILEELIPKALYLKIYTVLLDSLASEHAARVIAMQTATDNADALLQDLTLMYNKTRQQAITTELLDIVAGGMQ